MPQVLGLDAFCYSLTPFCQSQKLCLEVLHMTRINIMIKQCILPHLNESRGNAEVDRRNGGGDKPPRQHITLSQYPQGQRKDGNYFI